MRTRWAYANALMGLVTSYSEANVRPYGLYRFTNLEWYLQDNWRVSRRLALDLGLRFYHNLPQADIRGQTAAFVAELWDPARAPVMIMNGRDASGNRVGVDPRNGTIYSAGLVGTFVPGVGDAANGMVLSGTKGFPMSLYTLPGLRLGPRFGFAFDPFGKGKTALRGGFGLFYDRIAGNPTMGMITNPPTVYTPTVYYTTLDDFAKTAGGGVRVLAPTSISGSLYGKGRMPSTFNFSLGIQQTFGRSTKLDVSYVGSIARHLLFQRNVNPVPAGATLLALHPENRDPITNSVYTNNFLRPYRGYGDIFLYDFGGTSNYNSMQVALMQRMTAGFQLRVSYTFAKTLGYAQGDTFRVSPFFPLRARNYGRLNFDRDHVFTANYTVRAPRKWLPANRLLRLPLQNWEVSGTTMFSRGAPFMPGYSLVNGVNFAGTPSEPNSSNSGARIIWLGGKNFARPGPVRATGDTNLYWGNAGWGILRGPGINNWDLRLTRRFPLFSEKRWLEFRAEAFNAFNHTQFSGLDTTARFDDAGNQINPLFLTPTSSRAPRRMQFGLKLYW